MPLRMTAVAGMAAIVAFAACSTKQRIATETSLAQALISDEQSTAIGKQVHAELEAQNVRYSKDSTITGYVDSIASRILAQARRDRSGVEYHVHVIDDPKTVNAFATPGGHLYVYTGLLAAAENEAEVAGVIAHEAGHVTGRHVERAMVNAYGIQALAGMALGSNPSAVKEIAASFAATGIMRAHSRSEETEADESGVRYTSRAGYDPRAMITFFEKLAANETKTPGVLAWLSTHPTSQDRIENLKRLIRERKLAGGDLGVDRHRTILARLGR